MPCFHTGLRQCSAYGCRFLISAILYTFTPCSKLVFTWALTAATARELIPVLEMKDKAQISYSEIRGYSAVYPQAKFWRFSNAFCSRDNYSRDKSAVFVNKHLIDCHVI